LSAGVAVHDGTVGEVPPPTLSVAVIVYPLVVPIALNDGIFTLHSSAMSEGRHAQLPVTGVIPWPASVTVGLPASVELVSAKLTGTADPTLSFTVLPGTGAVKPPNPYAAVNVCHDRAPRSTRCPQRHRHDLLDE
jgi:hypothetical protein